MLHRRSALAAGLAMLHATCGQARTAEGHQKNIVAQRHALASRTLQVGVATHYGMHGEALVTFEQVGSIGLNGIRDEAYWSHVEADSGQLAVPLHVANWYAAAMRAGISPLLLLSYGHPSYQDGARPVTARAVNGFARYSTFLAQRLSGVKQFQVWNEWELPDRSGEPGRPQDYLNLFRQVAPGLRAASPGALVLPAGVQRAGCFNGYLEFLVRGGLLRLADGLALHTYRFNEADPSPEAWYLEIIKLAALIRLWDPDHGADAALYVSEMGFPSHAGPQGLTLQAQADYLERCILLGAALPTLRGFWWYGLRDKGNVPAESEHHYGLLAQDSTLKPSGLRMQQLLARLRGAKSVTIAGQDADRWAVQLDAFDGTNWLAQWSPALRGAPSAGATKAGLGPRPVWSQLMRAVPATSARR